MPGLPQAVPAPMTINQACGSGLRAVMLAAQAIRAGDASLVLAGGQENMSLSPHLLPGSRQGRKMGEWALDDSMVRDGLWDAFNDYHMGRTAENIAARYGISREEQDRFAARSENLAEIALREQRFAGEIVGCGSAHQKRAARLVQGRRISAGRRHCRVARRPQAGLPQGRHRHRRQRLRP